MFIKVTTSKRVLNQNDVPMLLHVDNIARVFPNLNEESNNRTIIMEKSGKELLVQESVEDIAKLLGVSDA